MPPRDWDSSPDQSRSTAYLEGVLASLPAALLVVDSNGTITYASGQLNRMGSRTPGSLSGAAIGTLVTPEDREAVDQLIKLAAGRAEGQMVGPVRVSYVDEVRGPRVTQAWALNRSADHSIGGVILLMLPESSYERFDQGLESISLGATLEESFTALAEALRYPPAEAECFFLAPARDDRGVLRAPDIQQVPGPPSAGPWDDVWAGAHVVSHDNLNVLSPALQTAARTAGFHAVSAFGVHQRADGRYDACLVMWRRDEGPMSGFAAASAQRAIAIASLAMAHAAEEAGLREATQRDSLTGLASRAGFFDLLDARVRSGDQPAILYVDLDGFRQVNETLGHLAGDAVLRVSARRLASVMRPTDDLARLGDDEFVVLFSGSVSEAQVGAIAERIIASLSRPLAVADGETVNIGASVGAVLDLPTGTPADALLAKADHALYRAKLKGAGQWVVATD